LLSEVRLVFRSELVDGVVLPGPRSIVQERAQVEAVVAGGIRLRVVGRGQSGHFVAVDAVHFEEKLDFGRHLGGGAFLSPGTGQLLEHGHRTAVLDLAEPPEPKTQNCTNGEGKTRRMVRTLDCDLAK